jgi:hypothetical protein
MTDYTYEMEEEDDHLLYKLKDNFCASAIEDFKETSSVPEWLRENRSLFLSVTCQPPGFPRVVDCNLGEESFENIRRFGRLYETVDGIFQEY